MSRADFVFVDARDVTRFIASSHGAQRTLDTRSFWLQYLQQAWPPRVPLVLLSRWEWAAGDRF
jgi:hypothetical protein